MSRKMLTPLFGLLLVAGMLLAACQPVPTDAPVPTEEVAPTEEPVPTEVPAEEPSGPTTTRHGGWLDMIVVIEEPSADAVIKRLQAGEVDLYAGTMAKPDLLAIVQADENLSMIRSFGSYTDLTFNPVGPTFEGTGKLNPFYSAKVREAVNWLIDRDYIAQELTQGMTIPRYFCFSPTFADYARYADLAARWEAYYAHNPEKARGIIAAEMTAMGATLVDGKWQFEGENVEIIGLIRTEDERRLIGNYFANLVEDLGFTVTRIEKKAAELSAILGEDPNDGLWHFYTQGWIDTGVPRTEEDAFGWYYTRDGWPGNPIWESYTNTPEFYEAAMALLTRQYSSLEERRELFTTLIPLSLQESQRVYTTNRASFTPFRANVTVVGDLAGAIAGSTLWPYTLRRIGQEGGALTMAVPNILVNPLNPIGGSGWIMDVAMVAAISDNGLINDPWTGLFRPQRVESAEVYAQQDLPIGVTYDWVTFTQVPQIDVPADAWTDWDPQTRTFVTVGEKYPEGLTSLIKSVAYYGTDLANVSWHDGSPFDIADIVMALILTFDRGKEASPYYDTAAATYLAAFQSTFKGFKITSEDPLVIEVYTDRWQPDAENNVATWWPAWMEGNYSGTAAWHNLSIGLLAEAAGETAFTQTKAGELKKEWMSYLSGPTIPILKSYLDQAQAENFIPYAPTLGKWITAAEATARWANLAEWYRTKGHFLIGTGPYYLERAFPVEGIVVLKNNAAFVDLSDRWAGYGQPPIPVIDITAPAEVRIGSEAEIEVLVSFEDAPYPVADILSISYLVFGATGELAFTGTAEAVEDGIWKVILPADQTSTLTTGSNKLTVVAVSKLESIPALESVEFLTTAP